MTRYGGSAVQDIVAAAAVAVKDIVATAAVVVEDIVAPGAVGSREGV